MKNKLASWKWQDIFAIYKILGRQLNDCVGIAKRFDIPLPLKLIPGQLISDNNEALDFKVRLLSDATTINDNLRALDIEIARRNKLIGVMG